MEFKIYKCPHCGNIAFKLVDSGVPMICCGEPMQLLAANVTEGALEKHVPVVAQDGNAVTVSVGSVLHPMLPEHHIQVIAAVGEDTVVLKFPKAGDAPTLTTKLEGKVSAYELCNLHGYWKSEN